VPEALVRAAHKRIVLARDRAPQANKLGERGCGDPRRSEPPPRERACWGQAREGYGIICGERGLDEAHRCTRVGGVARFPPN